MWFVFGARGGWGCWLFFAKYFFGGWVGGIYFVSLYAERIGVASLYNALYQLYRFVYVVFSIVSGCDATTCNMLSVKY
jgi:hypothetical protein